MTKEVELLSMKMEEGFALQPVQPAGLEWPSPLCPLMLEL